MMCHSQVGYEASLSASFLEAARLGAIAAIAAIVTAAARRTIAATGSVCCWLPLLPMCWRLQPAAVALLPLLPVCRRLLQRFDHERAPGLRGPEVPCPSHSVRVAVCLWCSLSVLEGPRVTALVGNCPLQNQTVSALASFSALVLYQYSTGYRKLLVLIRSNPACWGGGGSP